MTRNAPLRGVLFDFDGVLINSLPVMRLALAAAYHDVLGEPAADFEALFGRYSQHLGKGFAEIMRELGLPLSLHAPFKAHSRYLARYVTCYPGVRAMLEGLQHAGWLMGIATGKDEARTRELLAQLQLAAFFPVVLGCDSVARPKPAPDMVEAFCAHAGLTAGQVAMVGDAPADLACAHNAGCRKVAALWGFSPAEVLRAQGPDFEAASPAELLAWLVRQGGQR